MRYEHAIPNTREEREREQAEERAEVRRVLTLPATARRRIALALAVEECAKQGRQRCAWRNFLHWALLSAIPLARYRLRNWRADRVLRQLRPQG